MSISIKDHSRAAAVAALHPAPPHGIHTWLYGAACHLAGYGFTAPEIVTELAPLCQGLRRPVPLAEIAEAAENAAHEVSSRDPHTPSHALPSAPRWQAFDEAKARTAIERAYRIAPPPWTPPPSVAAALSALFRPGELLCIGNKLEIAKTRSLEEWLSDSTIEHAQFVVPSPMSKREGVTKKGDLSPRCLDNTGPRRWLVVEFDEHWSPGEQFALHFHLGELAPLGCIVFSAGKSCHGWFQVEGVADDYVRAFFDYAVSYGADPATWTQCQFVRLPGGWRPDKDKRQQVVFWNQGVAK